MTVADVAITHTAADGTLAEGDPRPHQQHLKSAGFRWSRNLGAWYLPASRDRAPRRDVIARAADGLRSAGFTVEVTVDEAARPAAEREADAAARSAARAAGLDAKATRLGAIADETIAAARARADMIPLGQPILVGHHSERRHRRDLERINAGYDRGLATAREADETARRAAAASARQEHRLTGPATVRRLETLRAEDRRIARIIAGTQYAHTGPAEGAYLERLQGRATELVDEIGYWERHLAATKRTAYSRTIRIDARDLRQGDLFCGPAEAKPRTPIPGPVDPGWEIIDVVTPPGHGDLRFELNREGPGRVILVDPATRVMVWARLQVSAS